LLTTFYANLRVSWTKKAIGDFRMGLNSARKTEIKRGMGIKIIL